MSWTSRTEGSALAGATSGARRSSSWWAGIDAARGLALIGLMWAQILPDGDDRTQVPTWPYLLLSGNAAALFALLAGVGLALSSGGRFPHTGRWLAADRVGVAVRAVLIAVVGLGIGALMPEDAPADNILIYYGAFLVLAIPFLHLSATALFVCAAVCWIVGPLLVQVMMDVLPAYSSSNPTFADVVDEPAGTISRLLLTGTYPALRYMTYLLVGLGLGRVHLRDTRIQVRLLGVGAGLVICAHTISCFVLYAFGGYDRLLRTGGMSEGQVGEVLVWRPESLPTDTAGWLVSTAPHTHPVLAIAADLGVAVLVLGLFLLVSKEFGAWLLPLSAMGAMTLTLYTAHLVALSSEVHYDLPHAWFIIHLGTAAWFAVGWQRALGQGPLERVLSTSVKATRRTVLHRLCRLHRK
ncbi:heparan-alpha-glucosaminide N-acetyltransferase domain-containing protein [Kocuria nitroreducens]|uniref:heparan-alpha-glucosaminide N-acetyltransferase domain-containing protein n=1 Tax=Kocuria nitroreducens TaxID=3058914 RepID=UPI0036DD41D6